MKLSAVLLCVALLCAASLTLNAGTIAATLTTPNQGFIAPYVLGWAFSPNVAMTVVSLGYYAGNLQFASTHDVGLWTDGGTLLASATVTNADTPGGTWFYFHPIAPVGLTAGETYVVGGTTGSDPYTWDFSYDPVTIAYNGQLTYIQNRYADGSVLSYPGSVDTGPVRGFFGANFEFSSGVPEPSTLLLMLPALAALLLRRRLLR